jgi:hypothetical protein
MGWIVLKELGRLSWRYKTKHIQYRYRSVFFSEILYIFYSNYSIFCHKARVRIRISASKIKVGIKLS